MHNLLYHAKSQHSVLQVRPGTNCLDLWDDHCKTKLDWRMLYHNQSVTLRCQMKLWGIPALDAGDCIVDWPLCAECKEEERAIAAGVKCKAAYEKSAAVSPCTKKSAWLHQTRSMQWNYEYITFVIIGVLCHIRTGNGVSNDISITWLGFEFLGLSFLLGVHTSSHVRSKFTDSQSNYRSTKFSRETAYHWQCAWDQIAVKKDESVANYSPSKTWFQ